VVYATLLGSPQSREITLASLAVHEGDTSTVTGVAVLGSKQRIRWKGGPDGLTVTLPDEAYSKIATVIKITGRNLRGFHTVTSSQAPTVSPGPSGEYTLRAADAEIHGSSLRTEDRAGTTNLGYWDDADDWASWTVAFRSPGSYAVVASVAAESQQTSFTVELFGRKLSAEVPVTGSWDSYWDLTVGTVVVSHAGKATVSVRPAGTALWHAMNLRSLTLRPVP
jgi:hypothetical protein